MYRCTNVPMEQPVLSENLIRSVELKFAKGNHGVHGETAHRGRGELRVKF